MSKMPDPPEAMKRSCREVVEKFHEDEYLYRRVPVGIWPSLDHSLTVDAVKLPDISVARSAFGHPEWLRLDVQRQIYRKSWGVVGIKHRNIPEVMRIDAENSFNYRVAHAPDNDDYPHSEVRAYQGEKHLDTDESVLPEDLHLQWRAKLLELCEVIIGPQIKCSIRPEPPVSHVPEPHPECPEQIPNWNQNKLRGN